MNFIRLIEEIFIFQARDFKLWWIISDMKVIIKYKISAQYLQNYACQDKQKSGY